MGKPELGVALQSKRLRFVWPKSKKKLFLLIGAVLVYFTTSVSFDERLFKILFVLGAMLPVLFFHHSRSLWLAVDHIIDPQKPV